MKKVFIAALLLPLMAVVGCKKDLTSINVNPKAPGQATAAPFFTGAQNNFVDLQTTADYNENNFRLIMQYWQQTVYIQESQYELVDRQIPSQVWNYYYRDVIRDLREAKKLIPQDASLTDVVKQNQTSIAEIMEIYTWYYLVTTFGDIPYLEAMDVLRPSPKYDDDQAIFTDLLARLDVAINNLNTTAGSYGTADVLYSGNVGKWKKFANSIKLKMGMTIADADNTKAKTTIESAVASGVFTSNADNATYQYLTSAPNNNPTYEFFVTDAREEDFVIASTIANRMNTLNDPRRDEYFTLDASNGYSGGAPGVSSDYAVFSKPSPDITATDYAPTILDYAEVEFLLAEAIERGYAVGGTAAGHYTAAVTASIEDWGGTAAEAAAYLLQPSVDYATAGANFREKIGNQKWIAMFNRPWDAWIEWRRLDYPQLTRAAGAVSAIPVRFTYPTPEQNVNKANYDAAATAIGGDVVTSKLFWDKN